MVYDVIGANARISGFAELRAGLEPCEIEQVRSFETAPRKGLL